MTARQRNAIIAAVIVVLWLLAALLLPDSAHAETWSKDRTRREVRAAAAYYKVPSKWITDAAIDIVYDGAHESSGCTHAGKGTSCVGLFQFNRSWHASKKEWRLARAEGHTKDWRLSGRASVYRFVRVYRDGGRAAIKRHWRATYGR